MKVEIIISGPQGSGKSTLAVIIRRALEQQEIKCIFDGELALDGMYIYEYVHDLSEFDYKDLEVIFTEKQT